VTFLSWILFGSIAALSIFKILYFFTFGYFTFCYFRPPFILPFVFWSYVVHHPVVFVVWLFAIRLSAISHLQFGYSSFGYLPFSYIIVFTCLIDNGRRISASVFLWVNPIWGHLSHTLFFVFEFKNSRRFMPQKLFLFPRLWYLTGKRFRARGLFKHESFGSWVV
jgi:hypothetical protein